MKPMIFTLGTLLISGVLVHPAFAACTGGSKTLFRCDTQKGAKQIELCDAGNTIAYSFGKKGKKPDLALSVPRADASTWQWQGIGRYMSYSVNIPNAEHVYSVFWGVDKLTEDHPIEAGVHVEKNGELIATVLCKEKGLVSNLEGVDLKAVE